MVPYMLVAPIALYVLFKAGQTALTQVDGPRAIHVAYALFASSQIGFRCAAYIIDVLLLVAYVFYFRFH